ncbi:MAG: hypothetical protein KGH59_03995, partial [Candidatus Micrarchaeota archaeon]|nr:hypothetical protein [Candidatus Micrarchaeota archaeon]
MRLKNLFSIDRTITEKGARGELDSIRRCFEEATGKRVPDSICVEFKDQSDKGRPYANNLTIYIDSGTKNKDAKQSIAGMYAKFAIDALGLSYQDRKPEKAKYVEVERLLSTFDEIEKHFEKYGIKEVEFSIGAPGLEIRVDFEQMKIIREQGLRLTALPESLLMEGISVAFQTLFPIYYSSIGERVSLRNLVATTFGKRNREKDAFTQSFAIMAEEGKLLPFVAQHYSCIVSSSNQIYADGLDVIHNSIAFATLAVTLNATNGMGKKALKEIINMLDGGFDHAERSLGDMAIKF